MPSPLRQQGLGRKGVASDSTLALLVLRARAEKPGSRLLLLSWENFIQRKNQEVDSG